MRDYLIGNLFPADAPREARQRPERGDYIQRIHRHVKLRLLEMDPEYQYPRVHSFKTLIHKLHLLGLLERTGRTEPGALDPARGFSERIFYRVVPGTEGRPEWKDPQGYLALTVWPGMQRTRRPAQVPAEPSIAPAGAPAPTPAPPAVVPPFKFPKSPTRKAVAALVAYLGQLDELDVEAPEIGEAVERLGEDLQGWSEQAQEAVSREDEKEEPNEERLGRLQDEQASLEEAADALGSRDIALALESLTRAFPTTAPRGLRPGAPPVVPAPTERPPAAAVVAPPAAVPPRERDRLEALRLDVLAVATRLAQRGNTPEVFEGLLDGARDLVNSAGRVYTIPFPGLSELFVPLSQCIRELRRVRAGAQREVWVTSCRAISGQIGVAVSAPLRGIPLRRAPAAAIPFEPLELPPAPDRASVSRLLGHLRQLEELGPRARGVPAETTRVAEGIRGWTTWAQQQLRAEEAKTRPSTRRIARLEKLRDAFQAAARALAAGDARGAIETFEGL